MNTDTKKKVLILGGGCGALAAAFALTDRPLDRARHAVTVVQPGWRLGGKGASGRNLDQGARIEEHGLHIWSGFYENAFWMMRKCYRELDRPASAPLASLFAAFRPRHYTAMMVPEGSGWDIWRGYLPHEAGLPGDAIAGGDYLMLQAPLSPWQLMSNLVPWALRYIQATTGSISGEQVDRIGSGQWWLSSLLRGDPVDRRGAAAKLLSAADFVFLAQFGARFAWNYARAERMRRDRKRPGTAQATPAAYAALADVARCLQWWAKRKRAGLATNDDLDRRALFELADLFATVIVGMLAENVIERGFDAIDQVDFIAWLRRHGAGAHTLASPVLSAFYCYVFAYEEGRPDRPSIAAGTALRFAFRLVLCSRGAVFWEMMAGMGDTVFAPLYEVLRRRGVRFEFFSRAVTIGARTPGRVDEVTIERQLPRSAWRGYDPLVDVRGLPCWPSLPLTDRLDLPKAEEERVVAHHRALECAERPWPGSEAETLRCGDDFDHVVLATSVGPLKGIARQLAELDPVFGRSVDALKTVATIGLQLWMAPATGELGWRAPAPLLTSYAKPLDTWADMSQVLATEDWRGPAPRSVQYFCGALPEDQIASGPSPAAAADAMSRQWLCDHAGELFPKAMTERRSAKAGADAAACESSPFAGGVLFGDTQRGTSWLSAQWISANMEPSQRYVQSLPGTTAYRLRADGTSFTNLSLAGDWLRTGLDYGCVESAVVGGFQAARHISGYPGTIHGEVDFQTDPHEKEEA